MITHTTNVSPAEFAARLTARSSTLLVVYLWGPDCPNCVIFKRSLPKLLERLSDIDAELIEIDVYAHPEIATRFGVMGIFKDGIKLGKMSEFKGETYWANVIREHA